MYKLATSARVALMDTSSKFDWAELVRSVLDGDEESTNELVERTQKSLFQFCVYLCGNKQLAEDICHDAYVKALTSLKQLRDSEQIMAWLKQIARRLFLDYLKAASQSKVHISVDDEGNFLELEASANTTDQQMDVVKVLSKMSEEDRSLLILVDVQECSYKEIAQIIDIAEGTVKSRVHRARLKFSQIFGNHSAA